MANSAGDMGVHGAATNGRQARSSDVALGLSFLVAYVALEGLSLLHEYEGVPITSWNPGLGVVFALLLARGARFAAVLICGVILAEIVVLRSTLPWPAILGITSIVAGVYGAAALVARRRLGLDIRLARLRDLYILLAVGATAAILVSALVSLLLLADGTLVVTDILAAAGPLIVGDAIGIAVATPLTLRLFWRANVVQLEASKIRGLEVVAFIAAVATSLWLVSSNGAEGFKFFYFLFLPVMVAAVRYGLDGACFGLSFTQLGLVAVMRAQGYDANAFTEFQILMLILTATGLITGVVVSERERANHLAREADDKLKERQAEAAQATRFNLVSGMTSALAHEINQPMTAARALARAAEHLLAGPKPDVPRALGNVSALVGQIDHAASVVRGMREFLGRGQPHMTALNVEGLIDDAILLIRAELMRNHIDLHLNIAAALPPIHGQKVQLQQVLLNLIRNAMEAIVGANRSGGFITVGALRDEPGKIVIFVRDNGPGVAPAIGKTLFDPLKSSKEEGLGLGLAISQSIVEAHGGRVWLHESAAGATEFRVELPSEGGPPA